MAFTEAQLQAQIDSDAGGLCAKIIRFDAAGASATDVTAQNQNNVSRKTGTVQILQSRTAAQALTDLKAGLSA